MFILLNLLFGYVMLLSPGYGQFTPLYPPLSTLQPYIHQQSSLGNNNGPKVAPNTESTIQWINHGPWTTTTSTQSTNSVGESTTQTPSHHHHVPHKRQRTSDPLRLQATRYPPAYTQSGSIEKSLSPVPKRAMNIPIRKVVKCRSADGNSFSDDECKKMLGRESTLDYLRRPLYSDRGPSHNGPPMSPHDRRHSAEIHDEPPPPPPQRERSYAGPYDGPESEEANGPPPPPRSSSHRPSARSEDESGRHSDERGHPKDPSLGIKYNSREDEPESESSGRTGGRAEENYNDDQAPPPPPYGSRDEGGSRSPREYDESGPPSGPQSGADGGDEESGRNYNSGDDSRGSGRYFDSGPSKSDDDDGSVRFYTPSAGYDDGPMKGDFGGGSGGGSGAFSGGDGDIGGRNKFRFADEEENEERLYGSRSAHSSSGGGGEGGKNPFSGLSSFDGDGFGGKDDMEFGKGLESKKVIDFRGQQNVTSKGHIMDPKDGSTIVLGSKLTVQGNK